MTAEKRRRPGLPIVSVLLASCMFAAALAEDSNTPPPISHHFDLYGDPIPYGVAIRLGTERFRTHPGLSHVVFSEDAKTLVSISTTGIRWLDADTGKIRQREEFGDFYVQACVGSRDRRTFAIIGARFVGGIQTPGQTIQLWDTATAQKIDQFVWEEDYRCRAISYSPDSTQIVVGNDLAMLSVWDIGQRQWVTDHQLDLFSPGDQVRAIAMSPDGQQIAAATWKQLFVWNWRQGTQTVEIEGYRRVTALSYTDDHHLAIAVQRFDDEPALVIFDVKQQKIRRGFVPPRMKSLSAGQMQLSPDGKYLAVPNSLNRGSPKNNAVLVWDVTSGELVKRLQMENVRPVSVAFSADQQRIAATSDSEIAVWDWETERRRSAHVVGHNAVATSVRFTLDDSKMVTASDDGTARVWESETGKPLGVLRHEHWVRGLAVSQNGRWVATSSLDDSVAVWNCDSLKRVRSLPSHGKHGGHRVVAFSPDTSRLASWGDDGVLRIWDLETGRPLKQQPIRPGGLLLWDEEDGLSRMDHCAMAPDASKLLVGTQGNTYLFDTRSGAEVKTILGEHSVKAACFSADATQLLIARELQVPPKAAPPDAQIPQLPVKQHEFAMFSLADDSLAWRFTVQGRCGPMSLSSDGKLAAVTSRGDKFDSLVLINAQTGKRIGGIDRIDRLAWGNRGGMLAFSHDGTRFAACMPDTTVLVWNLADLGR
jgi:WD40 repeat protein